MDSFKKCLLGFKMIYLVYLLFAFNAFINGMAWMNLATYAIAFLGVFFCVWMLLRWKRYKKAIAVVGLGLFVLSYAVSAFTHASYGGVIENTKGFLWLIFPIFLLYVSAFDMTRKEMEIELIWMSMPYIVYCTVANCVSLSMLVWGRMYDYIDPTGIAHGIGYRWERLWGVYDDPNHGATISAIAVFLLLYLYRKTKKLWQKILIVICGVIQYAYIVFSDSRTGFVCLMAGIIFYAFFQLIKQKQVQWKKILLFVGIFTMIIAGDFGLKAAYASYDDMVKAQEVQEQSDVKEKTDKKENQKTENKSNEKSNSKTNEQSDKSAVEERKEDLERDYSNGRVVLWNDGLNIVKTSPLIGVGFRNMSAYAQKHFPNSHMVKNLYEVHYDSMHNLEIDVLVAQGLIGVFLFLGIFISMFWKILQRVSRFQKENDCFLIVMLSSALALGVAATFLSYIFYVNAPQNFCFWLILGYGMHALTEKEEA